METIGLASDHAGYDLKIIIKNYLLNKGFEIKDFGCDSDISCDYSVFAHLLGFAIDKNEIQMGFVFCGSGNGINMTINKHNRIRSALCWNTEIASLARHHNNANVCSLPSRFVTEVEALNIINTFLEEEFDGGRHISRVDNIPI